MKKTILLTLLAGMTAACPDSETPELTSIDGLKGGELTSDVSVAGALNATSLVSDAAVIGDVVATDVNTTTLTVETATAGELRASGTTTETLTVTGDATLTQVKADTLTTAEQPRIGAGAQARTILPVVVGVAPRANVRGAAAADQSCDDAFDGTHVCEETEFKTALRFFEGSLATLDGTTVFASGPRVVGTVDLSGTSGNPPEVVPLIVDDCDNWEALGDVAGAIFEDDDGRALSATDLRTTPFAHARVNLVVDGARVRSDYDTECLPAAVNFVCCL